MKLAYIKGPPLGELYYNPKTHTGVAIPKDLDPVFIGMEDDYNPFEDPSAKELETTSEVFDQLIEAAGKRSSGEVEKIIKQHFEKVLED